jgi:hypothetical protein
VLPFIVESHPFLAHLLHLLFGGRVLVRLLERRLALFVELGSGLGPGGWSAQAPCDGNGQDDHDHELPHPITSPLS